MAMKVDVLNLSIIPNRDKLGDVLVALKSALVGRGFTVTGSGDGLSAFQRVGQTAGPNYDVLTAGAAATWNPGTANSISNVRAWFIVKEPAPSTTEILFQRASSSAANAMINLYNTAISESGFAASGFSANTVNLTPVTAGTRSLLYTANTDRHAFGRNTTITVASAETTILNIAVSDAAINGVWPWYVLGWDSPNAVVACGWLVDALQGCPTTSPRIAWVKAGATTTGGFSLPGTTGANSAVGMLSSAVAGTTDMAGGAAYAQVGPTTVALYLSSAVSNGNVYAPPLAMFDSAPAFKGYTTNIFWSPRNRQYPNTIDIGTANAKLFIGNHVLNWEQGKVPVA